METADRLRAVALALPEVTERETWGRPTFRVRNRMFFTLSDDDAAATVKAKPEEQTALIAIDPDTYSMASYVGRHGWISVQLDRADARCTDPGHWLNGRVMPVLSGVVAAAGLVVPTRCC